MRKLHRRAFPSNGIFRTHPAAGHFPLIDDQTQLETSLLDGIGWAKFHWFFVDGQNDATSFADDTMPGSGSVYRQSPRSGRPVLITLRTREHQNMLIAGMFVQRDHALALVSKESRCRTGNSITV